MPTPDGEQIERLAAPWGLERVRGKQLHIQVAMGGEDCSQLEGLDVDEADRIVTISAFESQRQGTGITCASILTLRPATVELEEPLGDRRLRGCRVGSPHDEGLRRVSCSDIIEPGP